MQCRRRLFSSLRAVLITPNGIHQVAGLANNEQCYAVANEFLMHQRVPLFGLPRLSVMCFNENTQDLVTTYRWDFKGGLKTGWVRVDSACLPAEENKKWD